VMTMTSIRVNRPFMKCSSQLTSVCRGPQAVPTDVVETWNRATAPDRRRLRSAL
jgi:hypothetical protein